MLLSALASIIERAPPPPAGASPPSSTSSGARPRLALLRAARLPAPPPDAAAPASPPQATTDPPWADVAAAGGALYCVAAAAARCGGRLLGLGRHPEREVLLFDTLAPTAPAAHRLNALAALRACAADPLSVRRVARRLNAVQQRLRSDDEAEVRLACATIANVELYSHARQWFGRPQREAARALLAPPPPPPPPLVLCAEAPPPPDLDGADAADADDRANNGAQTSDEAAAAVPLLACELHPWVGQRRRRAAALTLSRLLLASWRRGAHEAGLLYVIDASLVARRLAFALAAFGTDEPSTLACLYCLAMLPLLGGGAQLLQPEVLERLLPLTSAPQPAAAALALHALRNATADIRLRDALASDETNAPDALRAAAVALASHPDAADLAYGALANLQQLDVFCDDGSPPRAEKGGPPRRPRRSDLAAPHAPPPPHVPAPPGAAAGGARAIPRLCQQLQPWASAAARRRGARPRRRARRPLARRRRRLALIDACDAVPLLLGTLGVGDDASATNFVAAPPRSPTRRCATRRCCASPSSPASAAPRCSRRGRSSASARRRCCRPRRGRGCAAACCSRRSPCGRTTPPPSPSRL